MHCTSLVGSVGESAFCQHSLHGCILQRKGSISCVPRVYLEEGNNFSELNFGDAAVTTGYRLSVQALHSFYACLCSRLQLAPGVDANSRYGLNLVPIVSLSTPFRQFKSLSCIHELPKSIADGPNLYN